MMRLYSAANSAIALNHSHITDNEGGNDMKDFQKIDRDS
jgi:hypothetical protein